MTALLSLVLFLSGAAAVAFQTLWFRQTGLIVGNTVWASSIVLASFMAGLALGNAVSSALGDRLRRPLLVFALAECAVGSAGVAIVVSVFWLPAWFAPWLRPFVDGGVELGALRLSVAFLLLLIPSTAMGLTLPLLVRVLVEERSDYGVALGRLYGWNTLGAMCGAIAGDAFLIGRLGVAGAALVAASCNLLAAAGGIASARIARLARGREADVAVAAAADPAGEPAGAGARGMLAAAFLSGGIFLALEVVWFRFLILFVHADTLTFSMMLAVVLAGIGSGGVLAAWWLGRDPRAPRFAAALGCLSGVLVVASYAGFQIAFAPFGATHVGSIRDVLYLAVCLMLPSAVATGVLFPLLGAAARARAESPARAAGRFVLANTLGSALGPLVGAFVLLPVLGMERSFFALAAAYGAVALIAAGGGLRALLVPGAVGLGLALVVFPSGLMRSVYLEIPVKRLAASNDEVIAVREGLTETIQYLRSMVHGEPASYRLVTNGYSMSGTQFEARRYMKLFVYLPVALQPQIRSSLLISFGVGSTAKALVDTPGMESIDVVDISRDVLELSALTRRSPEDDPLRDPRVNVHIEDGRFFLQVTDRRFDLITGEPPPPKMAGIVYLYTEEFFALIRDHLTDRGIATYWLPVHSLSPSDAKAVVAAFCEVFADCTLWNGMGFDWVLMGSRGLDRAPSEAEFRRQWQDPVVAAELRAVGIEQPEQLGALFMADAPGLRRLSAGAAPLTDRYPLRLSPFPVSPLDVAEEFRQWAAAGPARDAFEASEWVAKLWPPGMREATLPYFRYQGWFNDLMPELRTSEPDAIGALERARHLLAETPLETLPALLLGGAQSDELRIVHERVAQGRSEPSFEMILGIEALSQRRYADAVRHFEASSPHGHPPYEALANALAGREEEAREVIARVRSLRASHAAEPSERAYWRWLASTFSLPDPYASGS